MRMNRIILASHGGLSAGMKDTVQMILGELPNLYALATCLLYTSGYTAQKLLGEVPAQADIGLYGSFATTGKGHGTDRALVAGFNKWKDTFHRTVKKGEKGIKILAPAPYKVCLLYTSRCV